MCKIFRTEKSFYSCNFSNFGLIVRRVLSMSNEGHGSDKASFQDEGVWAAAARSAAGCAGASAQA